MNSTVGFLLICGLISAFRNADAITKDYLGKVVAAKDKCQKEFKVPDSVVADFMLKNIKPESQPGKCMVACFMEERGMMKDGKVVNEQVQLDNKQKWENPNDVALGNQVSDFCFNEIAQGSSDKCAVATDFMMCLVKRGDEMKLPQVDFAHPT